MRAHASILCLLLAAGCAAPTPSESLAGMYAQSRRERAVDASSGRLGEIQAERQERIARVNALLDQGAVVTIDDYLYATAILLDSSDVNDLSVARELALRAAERGDDRGFRLAAEATDRNLMQRNLPQKYGTQYVYIPVTESWILYRWDTTTSDVERLAMGVPTIADSLRRAKELNRR